MRWVSCAQRAMTLRELRWAIIVGPDAHPGSHYGSLKEYESVAPGYTNSSEAMEMGAKMLSHGLLETVSGTRGVQTVQFIHQTAMDFFHHGGLSLMNGDERSAEDTTSTSSSSVDTAHDHLVQDVHSLLEQ